MNPLGIYISVPFCRSKCSYCNFASGVYPVAQHQEYIARVCAELGGLRRRLEPWKAVIPREVDSIYLGGGTPGILSPTLLRKLWNALHEVFDITERAEITLESAPGQLDDPALAAILDFGVNRISFGVQSLVDREAAATGRLHTRAIALRDLERVRSAGIGNVSIDLIAGLPHQNAVSWQESLEVLLGSEVEHASIYMLEIDEDSRLGRELLAGGSRYHASAAPGVDLTADLYEAAVDSLEAHGLRQYEISNFARRRKSGLEMQSRHNLKYWRRQPYLGFGLDAHSMLRTEDGGVLRFATTASLDEYLRDEYPGDEYLRDEYLRTPAPWEIHQVSRVSRVSRWEELEEAWFLGLRLREGVRWDALTEEFGQDSVEPFRPVVDELCADRLVTNQAGVVRLTRPGVLLSNEVFARFLGLAEESDAAAD